MDSFKFKALVCAALAALVVHLPSSGVAEVKSVSKIQKSSASRKPQSEGCGNSLNEVRKSFAQEFGLTPDQAADVGFKYLGSADLELIAATHKDFCGQRGCNYGLYQISKNQCAKLALLYFGSLVPSGPPISPYSLVSVFSERQPVDGGGMTRRKYRWNKRTSEFDEILK